MSPLSTLIGAALAFGIIEFGRRMFRTSTTGQRPPRRPCMKPNPISTLKPRIEQRDGFAYITFTKR